ncbi:MAG: hypothetical protein GY953_23640 [bacterium]|nr:hypothetical protein [bacterium]
MGNGNERGFTFSRPGDAPAGPRHVNIATNKQAIDGLGFAAQKLREIEIPKPWRPHRVEPVIGEDQGGPG